MDEVKHCASTSDSIPGVAIPGVVKYAYKTFSVNNSSGKWKATCCTCGEILTESRGTTSSFVRYVK
jgi:hypothetical protein